MDENMTHMMEQLRRNPAMLQQLMQSHDGQALMRMLTQGDRGASLQRAAQSAARGSTAELAQLVTEALLEADQVLNYDDIKNDMTNKARAMGLEVND